MFSETEQDGDTPDRATDSTGYPRSPVGRALGLVSSMLESSSRAWGVREIARHLALHPSTAHRLLRTLEHEGLVERESNTGRYRPGLELYRIAWRATSAHPIRDVALPALHDLVTETSETALLGLYSARSGEMIIAASVESPHPLRYVVEQNRWLPLHAGATGLAILAFLPAAEQERILERASSMPPATPRTLTNPDRLKDVLQTIRQNGYAVTHGQRIEGAVGIAAPIFGSQQRVVGDIALTLPEHRVDPQREIELARSVVRAAERISYELDGSPSKLRGEDLPRSAKPAPPLIQPVKGARQKGT